MKVDVINNTDKSVKQQANGHGKSPLLLERGQEIHDATGTIPTAVKGIYIRHTYTWRSSHEQLITVITNHIWHFAIVKRDL